MKLRQASSADPVIKEISRDLSNAPRHGDAEDKLSRLSKCGAGECVGKTRWPTKPSQHDRSSPSISSLESNGDDPIAASGSPPQSDSPDSPPIIKLIFRYPC
ncbi:Uncharacterized protein HZ326_25858 [Fusarium oxysporum f. sp. albedinis]|nr:Uncharacterized protein HZ326_25858 [Fusarium oxysporum f. sp. albedinis]